MASEMHWFRWHHGTVNDPKMMLIARRAGVSVPDVLAVWAAILESASESEERGTFTLDCEAHDCLFGFEDGCTSRIVEAMEQRKLVEGDTVVAWHRRQVKREREEPANSTARVQNHRARKRGDPPPGSPPAFDSGPPSAPLFPDDLSDPAHHHGPPDDDIPPPAAWEGDGVSPPFQPRNAMKRHETPRGEERREEEKNSHALPQPPVRGRAREDSLTPAEAACRAMQVAGLTDASPGDQKLLGLLAKGVAIATFGDAAAKAHRKGKGMGYALAIVASDLAAGGGAAPPVASAVQWDATKSSIEATAAQLGLPPWDRDAFDHGRGEAFAAYTSRVRRIIEGERAPA